MHATHLVVWLLLIISTTAFSQTGTLFNPFTTLKQARTVERAGHYYFELDEGQTFFRTYVDAEGFVQIALEYGEDEPPAALPSLASLPPDTRRGILNPDVLAALTDTKEVRISSSASHVLDARTNDLGIVQRVLTNRTFKSDPADNAINLAWTGPGAQYLTAPATVENSHPVLTLDRIIVHTNGNGNGMHWVPYHDAQELTFFGSRNVPPTEKWTLWVRGSIIVPNPPLGSSANPFTSLAQTSSVTAAGHYFFDLDGNTFSTYVDTGGYVQIALEHGEDDPVTALPQQFVLADTARRGILPPAVLASLTEMTEVRMSSSVPNKLDARTTEPGIIQRVLSNTTLKSDPADNGINRSWTGPGAQYLTADVTVGNQHPVRTLDRIIVHTTGNANGMHWVPYHGAQELTYFGRTNVPSTEKWTVWVRGACENATAGPAIFARFLTPLRHSLCVTPTITVPPPTATDACGQVVTGTTTDATTFTKAGSYTVNWTFTGSNGATTTLAQAVKVVGGASLPLPFYETAEAASASIDCWTTEGMESWRTTPDGGGRSFVVPTLGPSGRINRLRSPTFTLQAGMSYELSFTARGGELENLRVLLVGEGSDKQLFDDGALSGEFDRSTLLFAPDQSGDYRIEFYNTGSGEAQQVYLDEIRLAPYVAPATGGAGLLAATAEGECTSSTGRGVSGAAWTRVYSPDGQLLLDLNANGNDLGDVTIEMTEYATPPVAPFTGIPQLGRYFNIVPEHGSGPYTVNGGVRIRLYFTTEELAALRSALGQDIDWPDLFVTHYRDAATDCDLLNSDGNDFELLPPIGDADFGGSARTVEFVTTSFSEFGAATDGTTPVTLTAFTARGEGLQNLLEWSVATELDFSHYSVERSDDGRVYTELARVEGSGLTDYSILDAAPGRAAYYRLRLVDIDGSYTYGPIVSVFRTTPPEALLEAYPVPAAGRLVVRFRGVEAGPVDLRLTDALGRVVRNQHLASRRGMNTHTLDVSPLPSGTYYLTLRSGASRQTVRIARD